MPELEIPKEILARLPAGVKNEADPIAALVSVYEKAQATPKVGSGYKFNFNSVYTKADKELITAELGKYTDIFAETGVSQEAFDAIVNKMSETSHEMSIKESTWKSENGEKINRLAGALKGKLGKDGEGNEIDAASIIDSNSFDLLSDIVTGFNPTQTGTSVPGAAGVGSAQNANPVSGTDANFSKTLSDLLGERDANGNLKMETDPAHKEKVNAMVTQRSAAEVQAQQAGQNFMQTGGPVQVGAPLGGQPPTQQADGSVGGTF